MSPNELSLRNGTFFFVDPSKGQNFSIQRVRGVSFGPGMTNRLALEIVQALQKQIHKYSDFQKLQQAASRRLEAPLQPRPKR
jgi:hypothetical protein